jgi:enoyl-CoA hydratase
VRELAYTARSVGGAEALSLGLVGAVFQSATELRAAALAVASTIAAKSPVAVHGTKVWFWGK